MTVAQAGALGGRKSHGGGRLTEGQAVAKVKRRASRTNEEVSQEIAELEALRRPTRARKAPAASRPSQPKPARAKAPSAPRRGRVSDPLQLKLARQRFLEASARYNQEFADANTAPYGSMVWERKMAALVKRWHIKPPFGKKQIEAGIIETVNHEFDSRQGGF